ncbi:MAG: CotH kinase family protein [Oscillospiraceae bacterium]|nr:CotH kinase family protein [Oscillospiraceae bacterium]
MSRRTVKIISFAVCAVILTAVSAFWLNKEKQFCMDVPIVSEKTLQKYTEICEEEIDILFMEKPAAVDRAAGVIYIPQNIEKNTLYTEFAGTLAAADERYTLYFAEDEKLNSLCEAVKEDHHFRLVAADGESGKYREYSVVFTDLPVVNISGEITGINEDDRDVYEGIISVWNPQFKQTGAYNVKHSKAVWHYRGNSNYYVDKKSVKLSLKDDEGLNADLDILGNGYEDDDWILNALYMDDTNLREKLIMDMWNSHCETADFNYKMSTGEYAELVMNGRYYGLYLLENRVDGKYLELNENQVLVKGQQGGDSTEITDHYRIVQSEYYEELVWQTMEGLFNRDNGQYISLDNWIDISLFIQLGYMTDNSNRYNAFYIIDDIQHNPEIKMILWDTDLALGIGWIDGVFTRSLEVADTKQRYRKEDESLRAIYPDLDEKIARRYAQLRKGVMDKDSILLQVHTLNSRITDSGALARDAQLWGYRCGGEDTAEYLCRYIETRLGYLDGVYKIN